MTSIIFTHPLGAKFRGKFYTYQDMTKKIKFLNGGVNLLFALGVIFCLIGLIETFIFSVGLLLCIYAIYEKLRLNGDVEWSRENGPRVCEVAENEKNNL